MYNKKRGAYLCLYIGKLLSCVGHKRCRFLGGLQRIEVERFTGLELSLALVRELEQLFLYLRDTLSWKQQRAQNRGYVNTRIGAPTRALMSRNVNMKARLTVL